MTSGWHGNPEGHARAGRQRIRNQQEREREMITLLEDVTTKLETRANFSNNAAEKQACKRARAYIEGFYSKGDGI